MTPDRIAATWAHTLRDEKYIALNYKRGEAIMCNPYQLLTLVREYYRLARLAARGEGPVSPNADTESYPARKAP